MSSTSARHRKPSRWSPPAAAGSSARHRKRRLRSARRPALVAAVAGTTVIVGAGAAFAVTSWPAQAPGTTSAQTDARTPATSGLHAGKPGHGAALASRPLAAAGVRPKKAPAHSSRAGASVVLKATGKHHQGGALAASPVYLNPLRDISGLIPERVDMGADFGGTGPIYAIGNAVITNATSDSAGWPGGGWITYRLTGGPAAGLQVYVAEDVKPTVQVGQHVSDSTVVANMFNGGAGIETGWAMPDGISAESQLPVAGGVSGGGPFPTLVGLNFDGLLTELGVPAAFNFGQSGYGILPAGYPTSWAGVRPKS